MSVVLQIYAIIVTLSLIIVLSFYLLHRREVTRLSQKLQTLLHSFTHAELTLDFPFRILCFPLLSRQQRF